MPDARPSGASWTVLIIAAQTSHWCRRQAGLRSQVEAVSVRKHPLPTSSAVQ